MAKRYDPIMCMMVDEPTKAQDGILFYQLRFSSGRTEGAKLDESEIRSYAEALLEKYGEKQVAVSRQGRIVATYFNRKAHDSASTLDKAIKAADGATGDKLYADVKAIYNLFSNILLTYTNEQSVQKLANEGTKKCLELAAKVKGVRDEAIKACDASYEYEGTYRGAKIQITAPDSDGTRNVYLDGRALWQDEGSVNKVLSAVKQLIDRQQK